ncbi:hypothetical protein P7C70_g1634, partial [Phenoliferia sp. Uapishka_3]
MRVNLHTSTHLRRTELRHADRAAGELSVALPVLERVCSPCSVASMSILDPPILTRTSYEDAFWENDHLDHTLSRREIPGSPGCIQKCVDCGRWGNVNDGLFTPAGWVEHGSCVVCFKNERVRQKEAEREQAGRKTNRTAMWEAHFDESVNAEVALLQLGLLVDHDKFLPHNVAERVISGESNAGRRKWMKDLKERIHESGTLPTLQDPNIRLPRREVPRAVDEEADRQPPGLMRQPAPTESTGVRER